MDSARRRRFTAVGLAVALASFLAGGCDDEASPTVPAPAPPAPAPPPPAPEVPEPPQIRAEEVVDRETLRLFVEEAVRIASAEIASFDEAYAWFDANFRPEGDWRHGEIYVFVHTMELISFFHATRPEIEGLDRSEIEDINGVKLAQELRAAVEAGGGYVEYWYDNPAVEGDEETGSPKTAYATGLTIGSTPMLLGSGIYLDESGEE